jgi:hypothetical protein
LKLKKPKWFNISEFENRNISFKNVYYISLIGYCIVMYLMSKLCSTNKCNKLVIMDLGLFIRYQDQGLELYTDNSKLLLTETIGNITLSKLKL